MLTLTSDDEEDERPRFNWTADEPSMVVGMRESLPVSVAVFPRRRLKMQVTTIARTQTTATPARAPPTTMAVLLSALLLDSNGEVGGGARAPASSDVQSPYPWRK